jgi:hypothetical protein
VAFLLLLLPVLKLYLVAQAAALALLEVQPIYMALEQVDKETGVVLVMMA